MNVMTVRISVCLMMILLVFSSCEEETAIPRPKGYFRVDMPERDYTKYESECPISFEIPAYSRVVKNRQWRPDNCMLDMHFPKFNATLHLTYLPLEDNLQEFALACQTLALEHRVKASRIDETRVENTVEDVYGVAYDIQGNVASNYQFYLTDSVNHFVRASLYFNVAPNLDSLAPSISHIKEDLVHLVNSFTWQDAKAED